MSGKIEKLHAWIKKFVAEDNGLYATGFSTGDGWVNVEFMDNNKGIWVILATYGDGKELARINIGTYKSIKEVKHLLKVLGVGNLIGEFKHNDQRRSRIGNESAK